MMPVIYIIFGAVAGGIVGYLGARSQYTSGGVTPQTRAELHDLQKEGQEKVHSRIKKRHNRIVKAAEEKGRVTNDDVEDMFCISDDTARRYLSELEADGKLLQKGETGRGVHYEAASPRP